MNDIKTEVGEELSVKELEQLEEIGADIDKVRAHQKWLKEPEVKKKMTSDMSLLLYRLPLTDTQRENIYNAMKKEHPDEFTSLQGLPNPQEKSTLKNKVE